MVCVSENSTKPAAFGQKVASSSIMVCLCDEEGGWIEDSKGHHCSSAPELAAASMMLTVVSLVAVLMQSTKQF